MKHLLYLLFYSSILSADVIDLVGGGELEYYWFSEARLNEETGHEFRRVTPVEFYDPNYLFNAYFSDNKIILNHDYRSVEELRGIAKEKLILFQWEPTPISQEYMDLFSKVYTYNDDLVDGKKIFKLYYPYLLPMKTNSIPFNEKKLCVMVVRNWQPHRIDIVQFFDSKPEGEFDFYCYSQFNPFPPGQKNYRGEIPGDACSDEKLDILHHYRFYFCTESTFINGYISDKIFFCFGAGLVPVYYGSPNIAQYIPKDCYVDYRSFKNQEELYQFIKTMPEETYQQYLDNIRKFLKSEEAKLFTSETYYKIMKEAVNGH